MFVSPILLMFFLVKAWHTTLMFSQFNAERVLFSYQHSLRVSVANQETILIMVQVVRVCKTKIGLQELVLKQS